MRHAIPRQTHTWTAESDTRLVEAVKVYGTANWMLGASRNFPVQEITNHLHQWLVWCPKT